MSIKVLSSHINIQLQYDLRKGDLKQLNNTILSLIPLMSLVTNHSLDATPMNYSFVCDNKNKNN